MVKTGHDQIGRKFKGESCNTSDKIVSKGSKIYTNSIEYVLKTIVKKIGKTNMLILLLTVFRL